MIEFFVSSNAVIPSREETVQVYTPFALRDFNKRPVSVGTYVSAMDQQSGRGTLLSRHTEFDIEFVFKNTDKPYAEELLYSLMDYQTATLQASYIVDLDSDTNFVMIGNSWTWGDVGCKYESLKISGKITD